MKRGTAGLAIAADAGMLMQEETRSTRTPPAGPNRAAARRQAAQQRAHERRQEKTRDAVQGRISQGLDLLRYLMAQRTGIAQEHLGIIIEGGQARAYDVRGGSLLPEQEEVAVANGEDGA